ncbi:MAG: phosphate acyltransferase PlsX [Marinagarivorans sp.]|nr:phosphate acyltransferase PlsX [Marinagarivorans sp.]
MVVPTYLAVDVMGGDASPHLFVSATLLFLKHYPHARVTLFGDQAAIQAALTESKTALPQSLNRLTTVHCAQIVSPNEKPSSALRHSQQSSMWMSLLALAEGRADAVLSPGNTGALMAIARHLVGTVAGIERPAICKPMPTLGRCCYVLDLGANTAATAEQLEQFALMGAALVESEGISPALVGLLNVGQEAHKGTDLLRAASERLKACSRYRYAGYVEGDALYTGAVNVVVCDGFTGNIALKASEGLARYLAADMRRYFSTNYWRKLLGFGVKHFAKGWFKGLNPASYNGALLIGLKGVVVKSHGGADGAGFYAALKVALEQAERKPHSVLASWIERS